MSSGRDKKEATHESGPKDLQRPKDETILDLRSSNDLRSTKLDRYKAKKLASEIPRTGNVSYTQHCREELAKDAMDILDVLNILAWSKTR